MGNCPERCAIEGTSMTVFDGDACCGGGTWACSGGTAACSTAEAEVFDCVDNDCNGFIDDGADRSCRAVEPTCTNLGELEGHYICRAGTRICEIDEEWCRWDLTNPIDPDPVSNSGDIQFCQRRSVDDCSLPGNECYFSEWCCSTNATGQPICSPLGIVGGEEIFPVDSDCWLANTYSPVDPGVSGACFSEPQCQDNDTCEECGAESGCGWCAGSHQCVPGGPSGPENADIFCGEPGSWVTDPLMCAT